jgi:hypothetical protein
MERFGGVAELPTVKQPNQRLKLTGAAFRLFGVDCSSSGRGSLAKSFGGRGNDMSQGSEFNWPKEHAECAALARSMFISACVDNARYWQSYASALVKHAEPEKPFLRPWNAQAKQDKAYREVFATLTDLQKAKVVELLDHCVRGVVHSTMCTLDQFPHGEAELFIWDGVCGEGKRRFRIAPQNADLHDDFMTVFQASQVS